MHRRRTPGPRAQQLSRPGRPWDPHTERFFGTGLRFGVAFRPSFPCSGLSFAGPMSSFLRNFTACWGRLPSSKLASTKLFPLPFPLAPCQGRWISSISGSPSGAQAFRTLGTGCAGNLHQVVLVADRFRTLSCVRRPDH